MDLWNSFLENFYMNGEQDFVKANASKYVRRLLDVCYVLLHTSEVLQVQRASVRQFWFTRRDSRGLIIRLRRIKSSVWSLVSDYEA